MHTSKLRKTGGAARVRQFRKAFLAVALLVMLGPALLAQARPALENLIHVEISGLHSDKGEVLCALFSSPSDFPKRADKAAMRSKAAIAKGNAICEFPGALPNTYAVYVIHDENSNGKLDTNFMGIPREGVGASNNAKGHFGPPRFNAASFRYPGGRLDLKITITYL
jgi:uncharacterized protein (DUF2141 family)